MHSGQSRLSAHFYPLPELTHLDSFEPALARVLDLNQNL